MSDVLGILGTQKGILMRQKLDVLEAVSKWERRNKYQVAAKPQDKGNKAEEWEDATFKKALKHGHILTLKEESSCCQRQCLGRFRSFKIKVKGGEDTKADGDTLAEFDRPCKCSVICCLWLLNPSTLTVSLKGGQVTGRVIHHWPMINNFIMCQSFWRVVDETGKDTHLIHDDFCCNENMFAPSCCCKTRTIGIWNPDHSKQVGSIVNVWPGCNSIRSCFCQVDNYILNFPEDATPTEKLNLLGALVLVEYMVFEKKPGEGEGGLDIAL
jgi:hypothetical protein